MKNEIILTEEQRTMILDIFSEFSNAEKDLLSICCILTENGVTRRDLYNVLRVLEYEPSDLDKMLNRLVDSGLLIDRGDHIIWCPVEVKRCILPTYAVPTNMLVKIINKLESESFPSLYLDALEYKPLFDLVVAVIDYLVEMHPDNIEQSFVSLVYNYAMGWFVYGRYEIGIKGREDTLVVRALRLAKENVEKCTAIYTDLVSLEAIQFVHGFIYDDAQKCVDEIESLGNPATPLFILAQGYFYETYGETYKALYYYYMCYTECLVKGDDGFIKSVACLLISFLTSLLNDIGTSNYWMGLVHGSVLPTHHICRFYYNIINALNANDEYFSEDFLRQAKDCICDVNIEAPILSRLMASQSHYYSINAQSKRATEFYEKYCHHTARYGSTTGAYYILIASEISRLVWNENLLSCKHLLNQLDRVPLKSKEVAISVQMQCCEAYADYFLAEGNPLCKVYCEIALELLDETKPDETIVNTVVNDVFNGHIPSSLNETSFFFQLMLLKWKINEVKKQTQTGCLSRKNNIYKKVWEDIRELRTKFPDHCLDIDVVAASLVAIKNTAKACKWWRESIEKAIGKEKYRIGVMAAGYCNEIGFMWETKDLLQTVFDDSCFLNHGECCFLLTELATAMEQCGTRLDISKVWNQAISEAEGTELLSKVYYNQAICAYNRDEYANALNLIDKCLRIYTSESSIHDETLASILTYRSVCLSQQHKWSEAIESVRKAMEYWPDLHDKSSYNLYYNLAFYSLGAHEWSDAKQALEMIKAMHGLDDYQKQQIEDMYAILRMPLERRVPYMQTYYGDIFT